MRIVILIFIILLSVPTLLMGKSSEYYLKLSIESADDVQIITDLFSVSNVEDTIVYGFANDEQKTQLEQLGYQFELLPNPGSNISLRTSETADEVRGEWDSYPSYPAYVDMMNQFASDYPSICAVENIGSTINGRSLLYVRISDNVNIEEDEPEVMYTSTMHGNETVGYILTLRLINYLLTNYGSDSLVTRLVDSCEIWINPNANPDGTYYGGDYTVSSARRFNANGIDLNRNFPDAGGNQHPDGNPWQPETVVMMNFADQHSFAISANMHAGAEVVNYPWDTWYTRHADDNWYIDISRNYADSAQYYSPSGYMTYRNNGITNGFDWYTINGGRQDYMNFFHGCREVTLELSDDYIMDEIYLDDHWNYNKSSLLNYLENGLYGIRGLVTDAVTDLPVSAMVRVIGHDQDNSEVFTDPDVGDYHRLIEAGTFDLEFSADNYYTTTVIAVTVTDYNTTRIDVALDPVIQGVGLDLYDHNVENARADDIVDFNITLINSGNEDAIDLTGILSCSDSYVGITQASASYPTINALHGTGTSLSSYQLAVASDCPINHGVEFQLDLTAQGGYTGLINFYITFNPIIEDFESGAFAYMPWQSSGDAPWSTETGNRHEGTYGAQSGPIGDNQNSVLSASVNIANDDIISFYYKVSSELTADYLRFFIDDIEADSWSGEIDWTKASYDIPVGNHTFKWEYLKDASGASGDDAAWIDYIIFPQLSSEIYISTPFLPNWEAGYPYSYQLETNGAIGTVNWVDKYNDLEGTGFSISSQGLVTGISAETATISFTAEVTDQIGGIDEEQFSFEINSSFICGDVNREGDINILDIVYLINYKYKGGPAPVPLESGDVNSDLAVNILDIVYLINNIYKNGPEPVCP